MPSRDRWEYAEQVAVLAAELVTAIRDEDPAAVHRTVAFLRLDGHLDAVCVALAAMVPDDVPISSLLAWTDGLPVHDCDPALDSSPAGTRAEHGSRSRYNAGCKGAACLAADRRYQAARPRRDRRTATVAVEERRAS